MVACRHEISLLLFNFIRHSFAALTREIPSWTLEDIFHIYVRPSIILYLLHSQVKLRVVRDLWSVLRTVFGSCSSSRKVSHELLDTPWEKNKTNNRNNARSPETIAAAEMTTNKITSLWELLHLRSFSQIR